MLTQKDFDEIENLTKRIVTEGVKHLPSKEDFTTRMDEIAGELRAIREE